VIAGPDEVNVKAPVTDASPVVELLFGSSLLEFEGEIDSRNSFNSYKAFIWSKENQEAVEIEEPSDQVQAPGGDFTVNELATQTGQEEYPVFLNAPVTENEAAEYLKSRIVHKNLSKIRGRAKCEGLNQVFTGDMVTLRGLGDRMNGDALVSAVVHHFDRDEGWKTQLQLGLDPEQFGYKYDNIEERKASAAISGISGLQIAVVTDLVDPEGEHRVSLNFPLMTDSTDDVWARIASFDSGQERGAFFRPEIGDEVIVGFLNGDPRHPVVLGSLYSSAKPPNVEADNDNYVRGIYTKQGIKLEFNDEKESFTVETPGGKKIRMDDEEGKIIIEDENGNQIVLDSEGIKYETQGDLTIKATGDLNLEGMNVNIKANSQLKGEGMGGAEISSSAILTLQGSLVNIN
jgi:uncharacterized protein involved in type VI secretion and phage assembly